QAMADCGFMRSTLLHGYTSAFGGMLRSMAIPRELLEETMRDALREIRSGTFAQALQAEVTEGYPCRSFLDEMLADENPITQVEDRLRRKLDEKAGPS